MGVVLFELCSGISIIIAISIGVIIIIIIIIIVATIRHSVVFGKQ